MTKIDFYKSLVKGELDYKGILTELYQGVIETNKAIGLEDVDKDKLIDTYRKLCKEEGSELKVAVEEMDRVEFLDAIVDYLVIGGYLAKLQGASIDSLAYTLKCNLKVDTHIQDDIDLFIECLEEENYYAALLNTQIIFFKLNIDHTQAVQTVLRSNLSKFPTEVELYAEYEVTYGNVGIPEDLLAWQCREIEKKGRYKGVYTDSFVDTNGETRYSFWCTHDGEEKKHKYVKPITFFEPDFKSCWIA